MRLIRIVGAATASFVHAAVAGFYQAAASGAAAAASIDPNNPLSWALKASWIRDVTYSS